MALPLFCARSLRSTCVAAVVFIVSLLARKGPSMISMSFKALDPLLLPNAEAPDEGLPIGRLLLSDVAGPWLAVGFCVLKFNPIKKKKKKKRSDYA